MQGSFNGDHLKKYYKVDDNEVEEEETLREETNEESPTEKGGVKGGKALILEDWNLAVVI